LSETDPTETPNKKYQEYLTDIYSDEVDKKGILQKRSNADTASYLPTAEAVAYVGMCRFFEVQMDSAPYKVCANNTVEEMRSFEGIGRLGAVLSQYKELKMAQNLIMGESGRRLKLAEDEK
jgi:hypothetical protein